MRNLAWIDILTAAHEIRARHPESESVYGIPTGGCFPAIILAIKYGIRLLNQPIPGCLIVDDIIDSGKTMQPFLDAGYECDSLYRKSGEWLHFPWEHETGAEDAIIRLLQFIGEDPQRDGLRDTPTRVLKAWRELTSGYKENFKEILSRRFDQTFDEMIVLKSIPFTSMCEHHLLPFTGKAAVAYIPSNRVVGISKLARIVDCFAKRLQIQERMARNIADAIEQELLPLGVAVTIRAKHSCMACRGVKKDDTEMITSVMRGAFKENAHTRQEYFEIIG